MSAVSAIDNLASGAKLGIEQAQASSSLSSRHPSTRAEMHKSAVDFEASFLSQMFQHMFEGVGEDNMFNGGAGEESFKSFMIGEYAKLTAQSGRVGLSQQVEAHMLKLQEVPS